MASWLLDPGPIVAVLRHMDMDRARCRAALESATADLVSTEAVLTAATHLVSGLPHGIAADVAQVTGTHGTLRRRPDGSRMPP